MSKITAEFVTSGDAIFTVKTPDTQYTYRVERVAGTGRWPTSFFVKLQEGAHWAYLGKLDDHTGQMSVTAKSKYEIGAHCCHLLNRVLVRVWGNDHAAYEQHGFGVTMISANGQPVAPAVETSAPVSQFTQEQRETAASLEPHMFFYDIPSASSYPNPSNRLWRVGARINLSCWVIPKGRIPYRLMDEIRAAGGTVHTIPFASEAAEKLLDLISEALKKEAADALARTETSMDNAAEKDKPRQREQGIEAAGKRCNKLFDALRESAKVFGLSLDTLTLSGTVNRVRVLQTSALHKAAAYVKATDELKTIGTSNARGIAASAMHDDVPAGIMADALRDEGHDETAEELQDAFAD